MKQYDIAVIGGTGFRDYTQDKFKVDTDYGQAELSVIELGGKQVLFVSRHDRLQVPSKVNYKANVQALKMQGVKLAYCASATGRLGDNAVPGTMVVVDDFWNHDTPWPTFSEEGVLLHHGLNPVASPTLRQHLIDAWAVAHDKVTSIYSSAEELSARMLTSGLYVNIQGPGFSTDGEEDTFRRILRNPQVIGQTLMREARLLREMDIEPAFLALVTDHSAYPGAPKVDHDIVKANMAYLGPAAVEVIGEAIRKTDVNRLDPGFHCLLPGLDPKEVNVKQLRDGGFDHLVDILMKENKGLRRGSGTLAEPCP